VLVLVLVLVLVMSVMLAAAVVNMKNFRSVATRACVRSLSVSASHTHSHTPVRLEPHTMKSLLDSTDIFIFDCDGVLWKGVSLVMTVNGENSNCDCICCNGISCINVLCLLFFRTGSERISRAQEVVRELKQAGKTVYFVTNNSTRSRMYLQKKFTNLDIDASYEEILNSSYAAALYLQQKGFGSEGCSKKVYVVGEVGVCDELQMAGIEYIGGPTHNDEKVDLSLNEGMQIDPLVGAVVAGLDTQINYHKIQYAQLCINELQCEFVATNTDAMAHLTSEQRWAGGGAIIGALRGCTGREPVLVGKPSSFLINHIFSKHSDIHPTRICMVGDRLNTDILFGLDHGLTTLLTLSGVTSEKELFSECNEIIPHYFMKSIGDMLA
jgi:4-nitrophenyl phosphatase/phosphoglycolate phosphatase